ncbi:hypothetical protein [Acinetobacter baumannii]|nr:hypothetical protein [Acinetobacter baumannii]
MAQHRIIEPRQILPAICANDVWPVCGRMTTPRTMPRVLPERV